MENSDLKKTVNKIFEAHGMPKVTKFAEAFADGILFEKLFNFIYDEKLNCHLKPSNDPADRLLNWSRINQVIFFNYL